MTVKNQRLLGQLATALVCLVMLIAFLISGIRLFGFQVYGVLSGSMEPTYPTGSLIYVRKVDPSDLQLRDVITFQVSGSTIATHRIVEIVTDVNNPASRSFRTQGDANDSPDANLVSPGSVIGKVSFCIPYMGNLASYIQSPGGTVVTIIFCLVLVVFVFYTDTLEKDSRRSGRRGRRTTPFGGVWQRVIRQVQPSAVKPSRTGKKQTDQDYMHQGYRPQKQTSRAPSQRGGVRQGYYDARDGYSQRTSRQQYDQQGYPQQSHRQSGYAQQSRMRQYDGQEGYDYQDDYQLGYSSHGHHQKNTVQRQYPQQGAPRQGYSQQRQQRYARQEYIRQDEVQRGYSQGSRQSRPQRSAQPSSNRLNKSGTQTRTDSHSWSYGSDHDDQ